MDDHAQLVREIESARNRIMPYVRKTFLQRSSFYSDLTGANVYLKCENLQHTGSFKLRGAMNKYLTLSDDQKHTGVVAASTGNHGKAVAYVAQKLGGPSEIFAPNNAELSKLDAIKRLGSKVHLVGDDCVESEAAARDFATQNSVTYISPYNDWQVVAGQGTIGVELCEQLESIDAVFASVGGGGMIGGVATYLHSRFPDCQLIGCSPENSKAMIDSIASGKWMPDTNLESISDGTAGGVEEDSVTFEICRKQIDCWSAVPESEIAETLTQFIDSHSMLIEGAAAVAIRGLLNARDRFRGQNVVVILCGGNISTSGLQKAWMRTEGEQ